MPTDVLATITERLVEGELDAVVDATRRALEEGVQPLDIVERALVPGMRIVGEKYSTGEFYLPNLIVSASGMKQAMAILDPELKARRQEVKPVGRVVIGTVRGDIHEIGKSLVSTMLTANGFEVHDLGVDVPAEKFVQAVRTTGAPLVGLSALLTTTMTGQRGVMEALERGGVRGQVKVMVGGAPVTERWCRDIGADGYAADAVAAVALATRLVEAG